MTTRRLARRHTLLSTAVRSVAFVVALAAPVACSVDWAVSPAEGRDASSSEVRDGHNDSGKIGTTSVGDDEDEPAADAGEDVRQIDAKPDAPQVVVDGGDAGDAGDSGPLNCDVDGDGYFDLAKAGCADAGGLPDCDDNDDRTHPGQDFLPDLAASPRFGDWNCQNGVEMLYPVNVGCGLLALGACAGVQGFQGATGCGQEGTFVQCEVKAGLLCGVGPTSMRKQTCK